MLLEDSMAEFRQRHAGKAPAEVLVTVQASVILAAQEGLPAIFDGVPVRLERSPALVEVGRGTRLALVDAALPGDRVGVVACEAE